MDAKGNVNYDSIMHQGSHSAGMGKLVQSSHNDLLPKLHEITEDQLQRPNEEEIEETRKRTEAALNKVCFQDSGVHCLHPQVPWITQMSKSKHHGFGCFVHFSTA